MPIDGMVEEIPTLLELRNCNSSYISEVAYVNFILNSAKSPTDVMNSFSEIFFPRFTVTDGFPFNISFGCQDRYKANLSKGMNVRDAYYWAHVIDVRSSFILPMKEASVIANYICDSWNTTLSRLNFTEFGFSIQIDNDEVLIYPSM